MGFLLLLHRRRAWFAPLPSVLCALVGLPPLPFCSPPPLERLSDLQGTSPPFFLLSEHPCDERQQFLQRVELDGLPGHHMFHPPRYLPPCDVSAQTEVHDKRPMD